MDFKPSIFSVDFFSGLTDMLVAIIFSPFSKKSSNDLFETQICLIPQFENFFVFWKIPTKQPGHTKTQ